MIIVDDYGQPSNDVWRTPMTDDDSLLAGLWRDSAAKQRIIRHLRKVRAMTAPEGEGKRDASPQPPASLVERVLSADSKPPAATAKNIDELMAYLDAPQPPASPSQEGSHLTNARLCEIVEERHGAYGGLEREMAAELLSRRAVPSQEGGMREALLKLPALIIAGRVAEAVNLIDAALAPDGGRGND